MAEKQEADQVGPGYMEQPGLFILARLQLLAVHATNIA